MLLAILLSIVHLNINWLKRTIKGQLTEWIKKRKKQDPTLCCLQDFPPDLQTQPGGEGMEKQNTPSKLKSGAAS